MDIPLEAAVGIGSVDMAPEVVDISGVDSAAESGTVFSSVDILPEAGVLICSVDLAPESEALADDADISPEAVALIGGVGTI